MGAYRAGVSPSATLRYEDGTLVRNADRGELDPADFKRLSQWLDPEPRDSLFGVPAQRWNARKP